MSLRATRLCRTSPTIQMFRPSRSPRRSAQRVDVQQRLRRVLVLAVAGVDDRRAASSRETSSAAPAHGVRMTIASGLWAPRVRTVSLSDSPFSTLEPRRAEVHDVGAEALGGELERAARAGGGLVEEVEDRAAAQRGDLLDLAVGDLGERGGAVADALDVGAVEVLDGEQVLHAGHHLRELGDARPRRRRRAPRRAR